MRVKSGGIEVFCEIPLLPGAEVPPKKFSCQPTRWGRRICYFAESGLKCPEIEYFRGRNGWNGPKTLHNGGFDSLGPGEPAAKTA